MTAALIAVFAFLVTRNVTAALIAVFAFLVLIIGGMFLVAWLDDRLCEMRDASDPNKETPPKGRNRDIRHGCKTCGGSGTVQGCFCPTCMVPAASVDPRTAPTDVIPADPDRRNTQRGEWGRA